MNRFLFLASVVVFSNAFAQSTSSPILDNGVEITASSISLKNKEFPVNGSVSLIENGQNITCRYNKKMKVGDYRVSGCSRTHVVLLHLLNPYTATSKFEKNSVLLDRFASKLIHINYDPEISELDLASGAHIYRINANFSDDLHASICPVQIDFQKIGDEKTIECPKNPKLNVFSALVEGEDGKVASVNYLFEKVQTYSSDTIMETLKQTPDQMIVKN